MGRRVQKNGNGLENKASKRWNQKNGNRAIVRAVASLPVVLPTERKPRSTGGRIRSIKKTAAALQRGEETFARRTFETFFHWRAESVSAHLAVAVKWQGTLP